MEKYEVYVSTHNKHREMFRIRVKSEEELIKEINDRYEIITECTVHKLIPDSSTFNIRRYNINGGKVLL